MDLISMDLNASPLPEEEEENYERHVDDGRQVDEQIETSVQTLRRVCPAILCCFKILCNYKCDVECQKHIHAP